MCISIATAEFRSTIVYLGRRQHPQHGLIHVLGYQNVASNHGRGPNAMLLHLPGYDITQSNFLDSSLDRDILQSMVRSLNPVALSGSKSFTRGFSLDRAVQVFEHDIYTVVLAPSAALIADALPAVPEHKRPKVNRELFSFYAQSYPDHAVALCCFNNKQAARANPLMIWYQPHQPDLLSAPALDAHNGRPPKLSKRVRVDHWVLFGSDDGPGVPAPAPWWLADEEHIESWAQPGSALESFIPRFVTGRNFTGRMLNGDFAIAYADLQANDLNRIQRLTPVG